MLSNLSRHLIRTASHALVLFATWLILALVPMRTSAQDLVPKAGPQAQPVWILNATVHTVSGATIEGGSVLFEGGTIREVREGRPRAGTARGAQVIDGTGKHLYPGFVCAASSLGLAEVGSVDMTIDTSEAGRITPEVEAAVAVNPDSWLIPVTRRNGVLTAGVLPSGGLVSGRAAVLRLDGWTWEDMAIERDAALCVSWPFPRGAGRFGGRRFGGNAAPSDDRDPAAPLDELFDAAVAYGAAREADPTLAPDLHLEAVLPVARGERPILVSANEVTQIEAAIDWAVGRDLRIVILGGRDADLCIDRLVRHDVPVILTTTHRLPSRRDASYRESFELPVLLEEAGVRWSVTTSPGSFDSANARNLPYEAAASIAHGLSYEAALRSVTLSPAEALGVADRIGSIEVDKLATLFLSDGDPFDLTTTIQHAWIDGREIDLSDKQTALYEKYREKYRQRGELPDSK